ncbi:hypothetical protein D3C86_1833820 [compost metagenome]
MIAAKRQQKRIRFENLRGFPFYRCRRLIMIAVIKETVAVVDDSEIFEQIALKRILRIVIENG